MSSFPRTKRIPQCKNKSNERKSKSQEPLEKEKEERSNADEGGVPRNRLSSIFTKTVMVGKGLYCEISLGGCEW